MEDKKHDGFDRVLIRLRREYSKDEVVSALSKKLSKVEIELGQSKSYIEELEHRIEYLIPEGEFGTPLKNGLLGTLK